MNAPTLMRLVFPALNSGSRTGEGWTLHGLTSPSSVSVSGRTVTHSISSSACPISTRNAVPEDRYPVLAAFVREHVIPQGFDRDEAFELGLDLLLEGLERRRRALS